MEHCLSLCFHVLFSSIRNCLCGTPIESAISVNGIVPHIDMIYFAASSEIALYGVKLSNGCMKVEHMHDTDIGSASYGTVLVLH